MNIKLVAIVKDEAAYLSEWIFHHLYFGFDHIDIYLNYTSDNSEAIINKIAKDNPVSLYSQAEKLAIPKALATDKFLSKRFLRYNTLQARAYADAVEKTINSQMFTHIMFLDIDEFWTPIDFKKSIKDVLSELSFPDVASFYWKNKVFEDELFLRPYQEQIFYLDNPHYKTILKVSDDIIVMNTHRSLHQLEMSQQGDRYNEKAMMNNAEYSFILHRFQRHETEYISMLGRGDATSPEGFKLKFTRTGFLCPENPESLNFSHHLLVEYNRNYQKFLESNELEALIEQGRSYVLERKQMVIEYVKHSLEACKVIQKVFPGTKVLESIHKQIDDVN